MRRLTSRRALQNDKNNIIPEVAAIVGQYSQEILGVKLDTNASNYGEKLAAAYEIMKNNVSQKLVN